FNIEIAGGFGPIKGKIWRVGLMGYCSQKPFVLLFLAALEKTLLDQGFRVPAGAGVGAAVQSYTHAGAGARVAREKRKEKGTAEAARALRDTEASLTRRKGKG